MQDNNTFAGAQLLAARIEAHWHKAGYLGIRATVEPFHLKEAFYVPLYAVRSNIGPLGFPPRHP